MVRVFQRLASQNSPNLWYPLILVPLVVLSGNQKAQAASSIAAFDKLTISLTGDLVPFLLPGFPSGATPTSIFSSKFTSAGAEFIDLEPKELVFPPNSSPAVDNRSANSVAALGRANVGDSEFTQFISGDNTPQKYEIVFNGISAEADQGPLGSSPSVSAAGSEASLFFTVIGSPPSDATLTANYLISGAVIEPSPGGVAGILLSVPTSDGLSSDTLEFDATPVSIPDRTIGLPPPGADVPNLFFFEPEVATVAASVPVPGPVPALGLASAFGYSRKLRNRIKSKKDS